jgi:hypothetical protein
MVRRAVASTGFMGDIPTLIQQSKSAKDLFYVALAEGLALLAILISAIIVIYRKRKAAQM